LASASCGGHERGQTAEDSARLPKNTTVAVADGTKLHHFRNTGDEAHPKLTALPEPATGGDNNSAGVRHSSSSASPNDSRLEEDSFAVPTANY